MQRFLLIQLKRLGDLILTAPAVAALREAVPQAEIVMLTTKGAADLARCIQGVDRVIPYRRGGINLEAWSSALVGAWDACLDFTGTDRSAFLTGLSAAKERVGYRRFAESRLRRRAYTRLCEAKVREFHTVDFHVALVRELREVQGSGFGVHGLLAAGLRNDGQVSQKGVTQYFAISAEVRGMVEKKLGSLAKGPYAVVHPGTAREEKAWGVEQWAEVIDRIQGEFALPVVLTGSGDGWEHDHLEAIKVLVKAPVLDLSNQLSLPELAALIEGCALMVGVDSMAMHLAAMFGRPQVALFGPTNPFHWRPRHVRGLVLTPHSRLPLLEFDPRMKKGDVKLISTQSVTDAIHHAVSSSI